jgi:short-subunit dehydrogenase
MADKKGLEKGYPPCTQPIDFSKQLDFSALQDQSVLVTGGASGIGGGIVEALAKAG